MHDEPVRSPDPNKMCPHSGLRITSCKTADLCDCFDFPEYEDYQRPTGWCGWPYFHGPHVWTHDGAERLCHGI